MDDRAALLEIRSILAKALPPDSGATVDQLIADLSVTLAEVGLDPIAKVEYLGPDDGLADPPTAEIIHLRTQT